MNILVVEDESSVAEMLTKMLEELGNSCVVADDATAADEVLEDQVVDGVTLDLCMPGKGGLEWLEEIAVRRPELARKTLVITGQHPESELIERLARCGAGLLAKPFTMETLQDAVRCQIDHPGPQRHD